MTECANSLKNLWQELDHYRVSEMKCLKDTAILKNFIEKDRVYDFLAGLNPEFDQVRVQILGKEETISLIRVEESWRGIMLEPQTLEGSALVTKIEQTQTQERGKANLLRVSEKDNKDNMWKDNKDNLWCTYCKKLRHTRERCWKLNGKPSTSSREWGNRGGQQKSQAHLTKQINQSEGQEKGGLNSEEIERLRGLLGFLEKPSSACSLALWVKSSFPLDYMSQKSVSPTVRSLTQEPPIKWLTLHNISALMLRVLVVGNYRSKWFSSYSCRIRRYLFDTFPHS